MIDQLHKNNIVFTICTGKSYSVSKKICEQFNAEYGVFGNGTQIIEFNTQKEIWKNTLSKETLLFCVTLAKRFGFHIHLYTENEIITEKLEYMDNICVKWLPENLTDAEGSHNGENYLAYTFYLENQGVDPINYWYKVVSDDVIKNVDKAIRIMIIRNDEKIIYAKANETTGEAEIVGDEITTKFYNDKELILKQRENMQPGEIDKFTIVIFLEGDDPDCTDELIGGEMKMHMEITEEHTAPEEPLNQV